MADVALALFWHQHQPYYPDDVGGTNLMPWVRLHGIKDYYGMAKHLLEVPEMRCTINFVPSLLVQLAAYTERDASDHLLDLTRVPADSLTRDQAYRVLDNFFMASLEHMIRPHLRYLELFERRGMGKMSAPEALRRFSTADLRDLQIWFNLAWFHPLAFQQYPELAELRKKARQFSEGDKKLVLDRQLDVLRQILPLHVELVHRGQLELTTTPFYHPILPLLLDKKQARESRPEVRLPRYHQGYAEDVTWHVRQAVEYHTRVFGTPPRGMWPAEGSVSQSIIPIVARAGIQWIASDEEILSQSTQGLVGRDHHGFMRNPEQMYQPYRLVDSGMELQIVFRDHALSDLIGFQYQRTTGELGAADFVSKLQGIGAAVADRPTALVSVILDGENCWEHYPGGGVDFLRSLYHRVTTTPGIHPVKIGEYLEHHPPRTTIPRLFAGSWIGHNFDIWIGFDEDNAAWDQLHHAREFLRQQQATGRYPAETLARAWQEIYIAEGSDWFWWYGPHHSSPQDGLFDQLFRKHLENVYILLGTRPPAELAQPIKRQPVRQIHTQPRAFLDVKVDGRRRPIDWLGAGIYEAGSERSTMAMAAPGPIRQILFGFNSEVLFIRVDFQDAAREVLRAFEELRFHFEEPARQELVLKWPGRHDQEVLWRTPSGQMARPEVNVGLDRCVVVAIPFTLLDVACDGPIRFCVELVDGSQSRDRAPRDACISLTRPSPDFERLNWDV